MKSLDMERPAILGGPPIRPAGPPAWPCDEPAVRQLLRDLAESGDWGRYHGAYVPDLCRRLAEYHNIEHALVCSSGTSAVELALRGVGVAEGDEVVMAAYDFKSNFQNVLYLKALPVLVDLDPVTWQLDVNLVEAALTPKTKAILASHLHGGAVAMPALRRIADERKLQIVEDACQATGAMFYGRKAGTWGDVGVISFGGSKLITVGRGGAVFTASTEIAERIKRHVLRGNDAYPLSEIQAAIVRPQLEELDTRNDRRRQSAQRLCPQVPELLPMQLPDAQIQPAYYKLGMHYRADAFDGLPRDLFIDAMRAEGVAFDPGFRSNHLIHASRRFRVSGELPQASRADSEIVGLHHPVLLEEDSAIDQIALAVRRIRQYSRQIVVEKSNAG